ncbi:helix-turn-helix domain-containing protein [Oceanobacter sp. 3_MG-2023]|uniref:helix-turn-helix domain-containing protein n=1 Tax=Oceanobacter sp. 3_MG-2023 TaxID=3062622 RepID=UPI0027363BF3|nr:helix-turn-helix domain-containing protein [Oceanobacter sp. 3_MG-2023]MDP2506720.1 helix-turn-helix domain-containing protein [Oceanobacter sp. 3_MG-2023]
MSDYKIMAIPPVLTQEQFADLAGLSPDTVRGWIYAKTIPSVKIGRLRLVNADLLALHIREGKEVFSQEDYSE